MRVKGLNRREGDTTISSCDGSRQEYGKPVCRYVSVPMSVELYQYVLHRFLHPATGSQSFMEVAHSLPQADMMRVFITSAVCKYYFVRHARATNYDKAAK